MSRYRIVNSFVHAGIAGLCWLILSHLDDVQSSIMNYDQTFQKYKAFIVPALLTGLAFLFRFSDKLANALVEKVPLFSSLLRRLLSGRAFIEGDWPLFVVDFAEKDPSKRLRYLGFLSVSFERGQIYVYGNDWNPDGAHAMEFQSKQSLYSDCKLQYWYEQGSSLHNAAMRGYTEIFFFPRTAAAERHAGKFLDATHTTDIRFYAERRRYGLFERRLTTKVGQLEAARALWQRFEPRIEALRGQDISSDFV